MTEPTGPAEPIDPLAGVTPEYDAGGTHAQFDVTLNVDATPWADLTDKPVSEVRLDRIGVLPGGMVGGRPALAIVCQQGDGTYVLAQTSVRAFLMAAALIAETWKHAL